MARHDVVIREVTILDGTGAPPYVGDVAVAGDGIAAVGTADGAGRETIDGRGLAVAPGFIDVHTHDDFAAVLHPDLTFKVAGGVTTCIVGNCGMGAAPFAVPRRGRRGCSTRARRSPNGTDTRGTPRTSTPRRRRPTSAC